MGELQASDEYIRSSIIRNRKGLFWLISALLLLLLLVKVRELTTLVLLSYGISLLLDPIVSKLEKRNISRSLAVIGIYVLIILVAVLLVLMLVPAAIREYRDLIQFLPDYIKASGEKLDKLLQSYLDISLAGTIDELSVRAREHLSALGTEQIKSFVSGVAQTVLSGYSFVLTIVNLVLLPFLVYYLTRDLRIIHSFLGGFLSEENRKRVRTVGGDILKHVYAFFEGQLTVALILAAMYIVGLWLVGLPKAIIVGLITGLLNVVPYLGIAIGLVLATVISVVTDGSLVQLALVWGVFVVCQAVEGNLLTPKIVGESVGIHPLGVMLTLIIGGQLLGLLGLVLAIPAAAAIRVLFCYLKTSIEEQP